ncbi:putative retrotransposon protein [Tanacetum coccineum]
MDGAVHTYKARLVAKGYTQTPKMDYEETFSPVADIRAIRILIAIVNPVDLHWTTVKNILKYLKNTKDMFLVYGEVEYIAAYDASKEAVWVKKFISGLGVVPTIEEPINMYCDNTGAITIANESGITKGTRHFRAKVHYLREVIEYGDVKLEKVYTDDNLADLFTKALAFLKYSEHTRNIGMLSASSLM